MQEALHARRQARLHAHLQRQRAPVAAQPVGPLQVHGEAHGGAEGEEAERRGEQRPARHDSLFGFLSAAKVPGSVPALTFIPSYSGDLMAPFDPAGPTSSLWTIGNLWSH